MIFSTALITGCGGDIAQAIARISRETGALGNLIGCDVHTAHAGEEFFSRCLVVPRATDPNYFKTLKRLISDNKIDVVVPTSEAEIFQLVAARRRGEDLAVPIIVANNLAIDVGLDKYATAELLMREGLGVPWTKVVGEARPPQLPCILKPRFGQGSKGLRIVETEIQVEQYTLTRKGDLWQEQLLPEDQEYTCGLYRCRAGDTRTLILRRRLQGGLTNSGEVVDSDEIARLLHRVADVLKLSGSVNVQLRLTHDGPKIFEINPRFSSTVGFRNRLGFRDFIWSLLDARAMKIESYCPPAVGSRIYRAAQEIVLGPRMQS